MYRYVHFVAVEAPSSKNIMTERVCVLGLSFIVVKKKRVEMYLARSLIRNCYQYYY